MAANEGFERVRSPFDLPTHQKRLRHLKSIWMRNLQCKSFNRSEVSKMDAFFTLHKDENSEAVYKSEKIIGSMNPSWKSFDVSFFEDKLDTISKYVVIKIWIGIGKNVKLLVDLQINLDGLMFLADKLQMEGVKYTPNTVIFGMFDKYFVDSKIIQTLTKQEEEVENKKQLAVKMLHVYLANQRRSYNSNSLTRIHTILRAVKQTQASVRRVHQHIQDKLIAAQQLDEKLAKREELLLKVNQLGNELIWQTTKLQTDKDTFDRQHNTIRSRYEKLKENKNNLNISRNKLDEERQTYNQQREKWIKESAQLLIRRKQLIGDLATSVFPIIESEKQEMYICAVRLPNSESYQGQDEMMIAVALGYTCHLTLMISQILSLPLRYIMEFRGSRSQIRDHIHVKLTEKDRDFPLYGKGKEKFQFNYGVFLLNKNISQLRFYCGLGTSDLRLTLPNLKSLLELRLGVKCDHTTTHSLTPSVSGGQTTVSSSVKDGSRSMTGSSSASGNTQQDQSTLLNSLDTEINESYLPLDRQISEFEYHSKSVLEHKQLLHQDSYDNKGEFQTNSIETSKNPLFLTSDFSINASSSDIHMHNNTNSEPNQDETQSDSFVNSTFTVMSKDLNDIKGSNSDDYVSSSEFTDTLT
ncbi:UV radiation resistance-associated gene protein isoform X1 [Patella vulgata]|uniref:UV radiation resistance-associated gene protein isoform X1 n=1 Tax=Patella vulgata TaxID=6465 RepID=UPI0021803FDA|nr:UV radiation resistance-associated gene protein isoform X1 [Patella vulgata]